MTEEKIAKMPDDMSIEELHEHYSEMLATANDLGFKVPDDLLVETDDAAKLREVCAKLDDGITAFRAGLDVTDEKSEEGLPPPQKMKKPKEAVPGAKKVNKAADKPSGAKKKPVAKGSSPVVKGDSTGKTAKPKGSPEAPSSTSKREESTMAKTAKKAAKKAPAKKVAKKAAGAGRPASKTYKDDAKIVAKVDENPCRAGTGRFDRVAQILKHNGKTVAAFVKAGGKVASLRYSEEQGWIKVA